MIDLDLNEEKFDYENITYQYALSDNETDDQQEPVVKRRKQTITTTSTPALSQANEPSNGFN